MTKMTTAEIMDQSHATSSRYFHAAIVTIDTEFGEGYAKEHPELIGAFMKTSATDYLASTIGAIIQDHAETISNSIGMISLDVNS